MLCLLTDFYYNIFYKSYVCIYNSTHNTLINISMCQPNDPNKLPERHVKDKVFLYSSNQAISTKLLLAQDASNSRWNLKRPLSSSYRVLPWFQKKPFLLVSLKHNSTAQTCQVIKHIEISARVICKNDNFNSVNTSADCLCAHNATSEHLCVNL